MKVPVLNIKGKITGREVELSKKVFGIDPNEEKSWVKKYLFIHVWYLAENG